MQVQSFLDGTHDLQEVSFGTKQEIFELLKEFNFSSKLAKQIVKIPWVSGCQIGRGVTLEGEPTSRVLKIVKCREAEVAGIDHVFEDFVADTDDVVRITNLQVGLSATQSAWHLKAMNEVTSRGASNDR